MKFLALAVVLGFGCLLAGDIATAGGSVSTPFKVTIVRPPLDVTFSPASAKVPCDTKPGTVIATVKTTGGNGNPVKPILSGSTNFVLQGMNVIVAPAGIAAADCPGKSEMVHVAATQ
jgi:hypothetical protein